MDRDPFSTREQLKVILPAWLVDVLGPYDDEVPWPVIIAKWGAIALLIALLLDAAGLKGDPWIWITSGIAILLLAAAME